MATSTILIKQIDIGGTQYNIDATKFAGKTESEWKELIEAALDIKVLETLPAANATSWETYHNSIVLIPSTKTGTDNVKDEYVIIRGGTSGSYTYSWEKIGSTEVDLSNYVTKDTYPVETGGTTVTGEAGAQTATGSATVTYEKAAEATGSAGAGEADVTGEAGGFTISGSKFTFSGTKATLTGTPANGTVKIDKHLYTPAGSITGSQAVGAHSHTVSTSAATVSAISEFDGGSVPTSASFTYVSGGTTKSVLTGVTADGTANVNTDAIKGVTLAASTVSTDGPGYVESLNKKYLHTTAASTASVTINGGSATGTFNTGAIKSATLDIKTGATTGYQQFVEEVSISDGAVGGSFNTDAIKSVSGTKNYGFASSTNNIMYAPTVSDTGVLSWSVANAATQDAHTPDAATKGSPTYTKQALTVTKKYAKVATEAADTASVNYTAPKLGGTTSFVTSAIGSITAATTASTGDITFAEGSNTKYMKASTTAASTVAVLTGVKASGTTAAYTSLTTASANQITGVGTAATLKYSDVSALTGVTVNDGGAVTIKGSNFGFSGIAATLEHTQTATATTSYNSLTAVSGAVSITYTPAGSIGGSQTVDAHTHSYTKPTAHTHTIALTDASATGTASVAVSNHTHSIAQHTHAVKLGVE